MKTALVTGASGNLGQAVVNKFLAEGYRVSGTVMPADSFILSSPHFETIPVNLNNEKEAAACVEEIIKRHGTIDAAVLTVGGFAMGSIASTSTEDIARQYNLNFETAYNIARPVFIQMMKQGAGRIFLIGSKPGLSSSNSKGMIAYSLAKSLLFRLAELMNDEATGTNVVTAVVVPGTIDTPQNRKTMPDADFDAWVKPTSIADTIYYYTTDAAAIIREPVLKVYNKA